MQRLFGGNQSANHREARSLQEEIRSPRGRSHPSTIPRAASPETRQGRRLLLVFQVSDSYLNNINKYLFLALFQSRQEKLHWLSNLQLTTTTQEDGKKERIVPLKLRDI